MIGDKKILSRRRINGGLVYGDAETVIINANTDNLLIPNLENIVLIRLDVTGNYSLTGIVPVNTVDAQEIQLFNVGIGTLSMKDNNVGSTSENRFLLGSNRTVQTNEGISLIYDPINDRWRGSGILI